ncbi:MAG: capsule assembly Wzi family protein [Flavobacteriaceae bacterium]|nr:capsule assembly Wzi family protein [Flavobacteriaceae bacterium]
MTLLTMFVFSISHAQNKTLDYLIEVNSAFSNTKTLPFWLTANRFGSVPNSDNIQLNTTLFSDFNNQNKSFDFSYKASFIGSLSNENNIFVNELYGSIRSRKIQLDLGVKHDEILWEGLSTSNGNITKSINARSYPGYNFHLVSYIQLPFAKKWLSIKGNYGDYILNDLNAVENTLVHSKSLYFKSKLNSKTALITGLNHYAQWGGTSLIYGKQPAGFKNYLKIITGSSGGDDALETDQINALGNHLGSYLLQLNHQGENTDWSFYWSHPFEDRSGRELMNYPDGIYGLFIDFKNPTRLITHFNTEFYYTEHMSGNYPHYTDEQGVSYTASGMDDYFNNGVYSSGWTYFGRTIGTPLFIAKLPVDGITNGIISGYNRLISYNISFKGFLSPAIQYKTHLSYTKYRGWFNEPPKNDEVLRSIIEFYFNKTPLPFDITIGTAADFDSFSKNNMGAFIRLTEKGRF